MLVWKAHSGPVFDLALGPNGRHLVSSGDRVVRFWDASAQAEVRRWEQPAAKSESRVWISPDGQYICRAGWPTEIVRVSDGKRVVTEHEYVAATCFCHDDRVLLARGNMAEPMSRFELSKGRKISVRWKMVPEPNTFGLSATGLPSDGSLLASGLAVLNEQARRYECVIVLRDTATGSIVARLRPETYTYHASHFAFSPDGKLLAGIYGPALIVWDVAARKEVARRQPSRKHFNGLAFTPDGNRILTASNDTVIQVWTAPNWQEATAYAWKIGKLGCVAVSADGTLAAAGGSTGKVVVWDLE